MVCFHREQSGRITFCGGEAEKIDSVHNNKMSSRFGLGNVVGEEKPHVGGTLSSNSTSNLFLAEDMYPADGSFFKCGVGFLAWALWGYISIHDGAGMQSNLFGSVKINASLGRKTTSSREQMRKLLIEKSAATVDNRRRRKRCATDEQEASNNLQTASPDPTSSLLLPGLDSKTMLVKALLYLNADSLQKER